MIRKTYGLIFFIGLFFLFYGFSCRAEQPVADLGYTENNLPDNLVLTINSSSYNLPKNQVQSWFLEANRLVYNPNYLSEIETRDFCAQKKSLSCELSFGARNAIHVQRKINLTLDQDAISKYVGQLAYQTDKQPEDAKLKIEDGKVSVFSLGEKGQTLDQDASTQKLFSYIETGNFSAPIDLPYKQTDPQIPNVDSISDLGVTSLLGEGVSNFRGSPANRIFNITVASNHFNGVLIKQGEEFSFINTLGPVDGDHGYRPELVILKDKTTPEFGGGICQVSTTTFRAAINSGLKITARTPHAYPVSYYNPQGMDATVYIPRPDLKFVNDTPSYILIQTRIEGTQLFFDFYGTDDGRKTQVIGPTVLQRNPDGSMKTTFTQVVTNKDGNIIRQDVFNSSYDSPSKYPHPGTTNDVLTQKPADWSDHEWKIYKKEHGL